MTVRDSQNPYLAGPLARLYLTTASPIILVMLVNGAHAIIDALFLGIYVGADALTAVTLMFPLLMLLVALSTLVGNGMASILSRQLGAGAMDEAQSTLLSSQALSAIVCALLIAGFIAAGPALIDGATSGNAALSAMGYQYISLLMFFSPLMFILSVQGDALRSEGNPGTMALIAVSSTLLNTGFNYLLIVVFEYGVAGSAMGTVLAQCVSLLLIIGFRNSSRARLRFFGRQARGIGRDWGTIVALGLPSSLSFLGVSVVSGVVIVSIQIWGAESYADTVAAYGVITRIMTFVFLPLLGLSLAAQSIIGNNFGARAYDRSDQALRLVLIASLVYCALVQAGLMLGAGAVGSLFVDEATVIAEIGRILPVAIVTFALFGPTMILSGYFQALGDAPRAAILGLARVWLFAIPLTLALPLRLGEWGIWYAGPAADLAVVVLTVLVLAHAARRSGTRYGLFWQPA